MIGSNLEKVVTISYNDQIDNLVLLMITTDNLYVRFECNGKIITVTPVEGTFGWFTQATLIDPQSSKVHMTRTKAPQLLHILTECEFPYEEDDLVHGRTVDIPMEVYQELSSWIKNE